MDTSRLIRYTIPGWVLIFSVLLQFWVFGGVVSSIDLGGLTTSAMGAVIAFLIAFASSAGLGLVVSTISGGFLYLFLGLQSEFRLPRNGVERELYVIGLKQKITTPAFQSEID